MNEYNNQINDLITTVLTGPDTNTILLSFFVTLLLSGIMVSAYVLSHKIIHYDKRFAVTLAMLAFISTVFMNLIQTNLALSLGMLGSLSIVRFRTYIRDPRDMGFIFWSMAIGLASATQSYVIGIGGSVIMAVFMIATHKSLESDKMPMLVVIRGSKVDLDQVQDIIDNTDKKNKIRAKNIMEDSFEMVYEAVLPDRKDHEVIKQIFSLEGIDSVNLLAQNIEAV